MNLESSSGNDADSIPEVIESSGVSDSILNSDDDNNNITKRADLVIRELDTLEEEHLQYRKKTEDLLDWIIPQTQRKREREVKTAVDLHKNDQGKLGLPINMSSVYF
jgi:hypothetical protein